MGIAIGRVLSRAMVVVAAVVMAGSVPVLGAGVAKDVVVTNPASDPVPTKVVSNADNPALQPFQADSTIVLPDGQCCDNAFVNVPVGKRLVIEYASARGFANGNQDFLYEVGTRVNGQSTFTTHFLPVLQSVQIGGTTAVAGQEVRLYADPGTTVMLRASRSGGDCAVPSAGCGEARIFMRISGHLVDIP